jgi:hypothetical protein
VTQPRQAPRSNGTGSITPEIEIAWARAVSRAFDDASYYRYLKANPEKALSDLGADVSRIKVKHEIARGGRLKPPLETLDEFIEELERKRAALGSAGRPTYQAPAAAPYQPTQSGGTYCGMPYPATVHVYVQPYGFSAGTRCAPSTCVQPMCVLPQGYWGPAGMLPGSACGGFSQVATIPASATRGAAPPQWIGGPPSGAAGRA